MADSLGGSRGFQFVTSDASEHAEVARIIPACSGELLAMHTLVKHSGYSRICAQNIARS